MKRFWRWLQNIPWLTAYYFEAAEGYQSWNPDPSELPEIVDRVRAAYRHHYKAS